LTRVGEKWKSQSIYDDGSFHGDMKRVLELSVYGKRRRVGERQIVNLIKRVICVIFIICHIMCVTLK
jgi:hypothetical protein